MRRVTIGAANIVAPVFAPTKVVALLFARMAGETGFRSFFRRFVLERNNLCRIAFGDVVLAGAMTRFTTRHLVFPTADFGQLSVRCVRVGFELIFVTVFAGVAADVTRVVSIGDDGSGGVRCGNNGL